jgi:galactokinase
MGDKQLKTLTVRVTEEKEREAIRYVMRESGCGRAAQAMLFACTAFCESNERYKAVIKSVQQRSREQNRNQQRIINSLMTENERLRRMLKTMQDGLTNLSSTLQHFQCSLPENIETSPSPKKNSKESKDSIPPEQGSE